MRRNNALPFILTIGILGILLGALLIFVNFAKVLDVLFIIIGIIILICNLPAFIFSLTSANVPGLLSTLFPIAAGILMIFWHQSLLFYILGIYLLILPLCRVLLSNNMKFTLRLELPRMIVGALLLLIGPGTAFNALFDVAGYVVIAFSVLFMIYGIIRSRRIY